MIGPLKNSRHEAFATALAGSKSIVDAYAAAGFRKHDSNAARLAKHKEVKARVAELQTATAEQVIFSEVEMKTELKEITMVPIKQEDVRPSDVLKAVELSAKMDSLLGKKQQVKSGGLIIQIYEEELEY